MADIRSPWLLYLKGGLFLAIGGLASALLLIDHPGVKEAFLLAMAVWGFSRAYYFAFYVIERYVDREYKLAWLSSIARHSFRRGDGEGLGESRWRNRRSMNSRSRSMPGSLIA